MAILGGKAQMCHLFCVTVNGSDMCSRRGNDYLAVVRQAGGQVMDYVLNKGRPPEW